MNDIAQERGPLKSESASRDERERQKHSDADEKTEKIKTPERFRGLIPKKLKLAFLAERAVAERADLFNEADWHLEEANVTAAAEAFAQIPLTLDTDWTAQRLKPLFMRKCLARGIAPPVIQRAWTTAVLEAPARRREQERELQKYMRRGAIAARLNEQADDLRIEHEKWKEEMAREAAAAHKDGNGHDYGDTGPGTEHSTRASDTRKPKQRGKQATVEGIAITGGSLSANADEAEAALSKAKVDVYRQRGKHVRPFREKARDSKGNEILIPAIVEVSATYIRDLLSQHSKWKKWDSRLDDWVRKDPPKDVADTIFHRRGESDYWRTLTGVTGTPFLRHDATIAHAPGFDDKTGMFLMEPVQLPADTPDRPTKADAVAPLATLDELLKNFPFVDESEEDEESDSVEPTKDRTVSHAVALSMLLTPIARAALDVAPMHIARAPAAGTGKSYLFDIMSAIVNGDRCPVVPAGKDEEEMEKRLSSEILAGHQIICLGNKNGVLSGELLCSILTQKTVKPRILSKSQTPAVSNVFCIFADGNNIAVSQDLIRRVLFSVMDAKLDEKDVLKRTFDSDPVAMVLADRGKYIAACLTILRAHALAGYPGAKDLRPLVGFDDWTRVVRGALVWLGKADPVKSLEVGRASDPEHAEQEAFIEALAGLQAFNKATALTVADIIKVAYTGSDMREALEQFVGFKGVIDAVAVGKWLARFKDKTFGAQQLKSASAGKGKHKWYLQEIAPF